MFAAYACYLLVFHFLSNMPLKEGLLYGRAELFALHPLVRTRHHERALAITNAHSPSLTHTRHHYRTLATTNAHSPPRSHKGVHARFWQQPNLVVFLWIGLGLDRVRGG